MAGHSESTNRAAINAFMTDSPRWPDVMDELAEPVLGGALSRWDLGPAGAFLLARDAQRRPAVSRERLRAPEGQRAPQPLERTEAPARSDPRGGPCKSNGTVVVSPTTVGDRRCRCPSSASSSSRSWRRSGPRAPRLFARSRKDFP